MELITIQRPRRAWQLLNLAELWRYKDLLWILALRVVKVRYKQTAIGGLWAVLQPLITMILFAALFDLLGRTPANSNVPYPLTLYCALLPWQLFAGTLAQSSESLVAEQSLITKVYFPRIIIPIAPIGAGLVDFIISFGVLCLLFIWYGITPTWAIITLPFFVLLAILTVLSISLWSSALNAKYRDFRYALPFLIQMGFIVSPVIFETSALIPEKWRFLYSLNPMVGVIESFRWALLGGDQPPFLPLMASILVMSLLLLGGLIYFRRMERTFADWI